MNKRIIIKSVAFFFTITTFLQYGFAQYSDNPDLEELEDKQEEVSPIDNQLQTSFVVLESVTRHNLNPHTTSYSSDSQILTGLYEGLFSYNPVTLEPQPAIATGYRISRDKKRITFNLRQDAYFSNGEQITAENVKFSWLELLSTPDAPYASLLDIIKGAEDFRTGKGKRQDVGIFVVDDFTLSVYLEESANYLPKVLCHSAFSVVHHNPTVYSGPFLLENQTENMLQLKKNPCYWDKENTHLEEIIFIQSNDAQENAFLFNAGVVNWINSDVDTTKIIDNSAIQFSAEFGTSYLFFKNSRAKPLTESKKMNVWDYQEFRNAVLECFPWDNFRTGALVSAPTLVYPLVGYPTVEGFSYTDKIQAKLLMAEAREKYNIPHDKIIPLVLEISEFMFSDEKLTYFSENLKEIGVELIIHKLPSYEYLPGVKNSTADMFAYTWIGDFADPLAFLTLFASKSTLNDSGWYSKEFDELLLKASSVNDEERYKFLASAEEILLDSGMVLPIYHPVSFNIIDLKETGGWSNNAFDLHPLKYIYKIAPKLDLPNVVKK